MCFTCGLRLVLHKYFPKYLLRPSDPVVELAAMPWHLLPGQVMPAQQVIALRQS